MKPSVFAPLVIAAGLVLPPAAAQASIVFDFAWSGVDVDTPEHSFTATGKMTIDKAAGEIFELADISFVSITVDGGALGSFVIDDWTSGGGLIDASGDFATWDPTTEPFFFSDLSGTTALPDGYYFGCDIANCDDNGSAGVTSPIAVILGDGIVHRVEYAGGPSAAAASMTLTAAVPLPASLPLAAAGLGALAWAARRRAA